MSFATQKALQSTDRFVLVRIAPSRLISLALTAVGGGVYQMSWSLPIVSLSRNGVALTKIGTVASNDQWSYDEVAGVVQVKLAAAPDETANFVTMTYRLLFTSSLTGTVCNENPDDSSTTVRLWEPRIVSPPRVVSSVRNAIAGVFTIQGSQVEILDVDDWMKSYLTFNDSYFNRDVDVWICIGSTADRQKFPTFKSRAVSTSSASVIVSVWDSFAALERPCYFGDTQYEALFLRQASSFPNMDPRLDNTPCPIIIGKHSRWKAKPGPFQSGLNESVDYSTLYQAVNTNYSTIVSNAVNRTWGLCRTLSDGLQTTSWNSAVASSIFDSGPDTWPTFSNADFAAMNIKIGDTVQLSQSAKTTNYGRVVGWDFGGGASTVYIRTDATVTAGYTAAGLTYGTHPCVEIIIVDAAGVEYWIKYGRDFTVASVTTSGGNKYWTATFANNFETNHSGLGNLDPSKHHIYFRVRPAVTNASHAKVMKRICTDAGLATNAASFAAADVALVANCLFSIPQYDETQYGSCRDYAELIAQSTLGYLYVNSASEAVYTLIADPAAGTTKDANTYLNASISSNIDYNDIVTSIVAYNLHDGQSTFNPATGATTLDSLLGKYLHGVTITTQLRHVLDVISARLASHMAVRGRQKVVYQLRTATDDLDSDVATDITLSSTQVLGGSGSQALKIITVDKSISDVGIEAAIIKGT